MALPQSPSTQSQAVRSQSTQDVVHQSSLDEGRSRENCFRCLEEEMVWTRGFCSSVYMLIIQYSVLPHPTWMSIGLLLQAKAQYCPFDLHMYYISISALLGGRCSLRSALTHTAARPLRCSRRARP